MADLTNDMENIYEKAIQLNGWSLNMSEFRRRKVLKYGAVATIGSLAGCSGNGNGGNGNGNGGGNGDGNGNGDGGNGNGDGGNTGDGGDDGSGYPNEDMTIISNCPEGSITYGYSVKLASVIGEREDINVQVEAIGGGSGLRGLGELYNRPADGYTFSSAYTPSQPIAELINDPGFSVTELTGITDGGHYTWNVIANPEHEFENFEDMVARYNEGEFNSVGGLGYGHSWHVGMGYMRANLESGWDWNNLVSFDGSNDSIRGTAAGEVPVSTAATSSNLRENVEEGNVDVLASATSGGDEYLPQAPAWVDDLGYFDMDFLGQVSYAWVAPPDLDDGIQEQAVEVFSGAIESDEMQSWAEEAERHIYSETRGDDLTDLFATTQEEVQNAVDLQSLVEQ